MKTLEEYKTEVSNDWQKIKEIPASLHLNSEDYFSIWSIAVEQSPEALKFVPLPVNRNAISNDYLQLYLKALNHRYISANQIKFLPMPDIATAQNFTANQRTLLEKAATINPLYVLEHLSKIPKGTPLYQDYLYFFQKLIDMDASLLKENLGHYFPSTGSEFSEQEKELYIAFSKKYPDGIRNIHNDAIKNLIIDELGLNHFIESDVTLMSVVPNRYREAAERIVENHLTGKPYLVITPPNLSGELKEAYTAYSQKKHPQQCVRLSSDFQQVKAVLAIAAKVNPHVKLVFMGPTLSNSDKIANFDAMKILECIKSHKNIIKEVVLMGHNTAGISATKKEVNTADSLNKDSLLRRVAEEFERNDIKNVTISAYTGEGYSHANKPSISNSSVSFFNAPTTDKGNPMSEPSDKVKYTFK